MLRRFDLRTEDRLADREATGVVYRNRTGASPIADYVAQRGGRVLEDYERFDVELARLAEDVDPENPQDSAAGRGAGRHERGRLPRHARPGAGGPLPDRGRHRAATPRPSWRTSRCCSGRSSGRSWPTSRTRPRRPCGSPAATASCPRRWPTGWATSCRSAPRSGRSPTTTTASRVETGGAPIDAAHLVLATPPRPLRDIRFEPVLPVGRADDDRRARPRAGGQGHHPLRPAFWRTEGLSGLTVTDLPFGVTWDAADSYDTGGPACSRRSSPVTAPPELTELADDDRIAEVQRQLDEVYPEGRALRTDEAATTAWGQRAAHRWRLRRLRPRPGDPVLARPAGARPAASTSPASTPSPSPATWSPPSAAATGWPPRSARHQADRVGAVRGWSGRRTGGTSSSTGGAGRATDPSIPDSLRQELGRTS